MAENATHNLHNLLTLRGAQVRDPHAWAQYLTEAIDAVRRPGRRGLRLAPLAHLGPGAGRRVPVRAARPVRLPARPDAADAQPGPDRRRRSPSRSSMPPALEHAWHTHGYYGSVSHNVKADLPALPGLVRRQPRPPVAAPAGRGGQAVRGVHGRRGRRAWRRARAVLRPTATTAGSPRSWTTSCSPSRATPRHARCWRTPTSSSATARRTAPGATSTCPGPPNCATGRSGRRSPRPRSTCSRS